VKDYKDWTDEEFMIFVAGYAYGDSVVHDLAIGRHKEGECSQETVQALLDMHAQAKIGLRYLSTDRAMSLDEAIPEIIRVGSQAKNRVLTLAEAEEEAKDQLKA